MIATSRTDRRESTVLSGDSETDPFANFAPGGVTAGLEPTTDS
jgi:hypothetical protein